MHLLIIKFFISFLIFIDKLLKNLLIATSLMSIQDSSINTSPSKQKFSFPKEKRFQEKYQQKYYFKKLF
jgi:hypothetical protein